MSSAKNYKYSNEEVQFVEVYKDETEKHLNTTQISYWDLEQVLGYFSMSS